MDLVDLNPYKKHKIKVGGFLLYHLCITAMTIDCPAGSVSRITKFNKLRFPELITEFNACMIPIINLDYNINNVITESLRECQQERERCRI